MNDPAMIRRAVPDDARGIAQVAVAAWRDTYPGLLPGGFLVGMSPARQAARWRALLLRSGRDTAVFVAETREDGVVGYGSCGPRRCGSLSAGDGEVYELYVAPMHQGRGIGRGLLATMAEFLLDRRLCSAWVWVLRDNPARWFYHHLDGRLTAEETIHFAGRAVLQIAYAWPDPAALQRLAGSVDRTGQERSGDDRG